MGSIPHFGSPPAVRTETAYLPGGVIPTHDRVNHPEHYTSDPSGVECIEITRHRNFNVGNGIKYLWRAGLKDSASHAGIGKHIEDLQKAIWYIQDEIDRLKIIDFDLTNN